MDWSSRHGISNGGVAQVDAALLSRQPECEPRKLAVRPRPTRRSHGFSLHTRSTHMALSGTVDRAAYSLDSHNFRCLFPRLVCVEFFFNPSDFHICTVFSDTTEHTHPCEVLLVCLFGLGVLKISQPLECRLEYQCITSHDANRGKGMEFNEIVGTVGKLSLFVIKILLFGEIQRDIPRLTKTETIFRCVLVFLDRSDVYFCRPRKIFRCLVCSSLPRTCWFLGCYPAWPMECRNGLIVWLQKER